MKKLILASFMLIGTSNAFALSMTCKLDVILADKAGYLIPSQEELSMTTKLLPGAGQSLDFCGQSKRGNLKLYLCAGEADFVGGYNTALVIESESSDDGLTASTSIFGTIKTGDGLLEVNSSRSVLDPFLNKLTNAGVSTQSTLGSDSAPLDEAVKEGFAKGILVHNEPVAIFIKSCELSK